MTTKQMVEKLNAMADEYDKYGLESCIKIVNPIVPSLREIVKRLENQEKYISVLRRENIIYAKRIGDIATMPGAAKKKLLCSECRKFAKYKFKTRMVQSTFRDEEIEYEEYYATCDKCGAEIYVPGFMDRNIAVQEEAYLKKIGEW